MSFNVGDTVRVVNYYDHEPTSPSGQVGVIDSPKDDFGWYQVSLPEFEYPKGIIFTDFQPLLLGDTELELVEAA